MAPTSREAAFIVHAADKASHSKGLVEAFEDKNNNNDNNKICAIYLLEQSGVGNFSCVKYRAKFVFLHSSLAKMPCGGRVDKLMCQTNRAFSWGTCLRQREVDQQHFHFEYCTNVCEVSCM